jgi:asparaginyl-tRNA synthetase
VRHRAVAAQVPVPAIVLLVDAALIHARVQYLKTFLALAATDDLAHPGRKHIHNTSRHLAEFWMIEPEIAFADLSDNATLAERLLKFTFETLLKEREEDLAFFDQRVEKGLVAKLQGIVASEFVRMDYGEAIKVLEQAKEKFEFPVKWGIDLQSEHERYSMAATVLPSTSFTRM